MKITFEWNEGEEHMIKWCLLKCVPMLANSGEDDPIEYEHKVSLSNVYHIPEHLQELFMERENYLNFKFPIKCICGQGYLDLLNLENNKAVYPKAILKRLDQKKLYLYCQECYNCYEIKKELRIIFKKNEDPKLNRFELINEEIQNHD